MPTAGQGRRPGRWLPWVALAFWAIGIAQAAPSFPPLTGRVVDLAGMLDDGQRRQLEEELAVHEQATTNQVVVVTVPDLGGYDIESYGYQLGRHWGIGQKGRDNGVLLIVAQQERRVRIEVGYGLEGALTDAVSANIIHAVILPSFKRGDFAGGIQRGTAALLQAIDGEYQMRERRPASESSVGPGGLLLLVLLIGLMPLLLALLSGRMLGPPPPGYRGGGFIGGGGGFGGFGGGGFGGGGGGFGGGGASGGW